MQNPIVRKITLPDVSALQARRVPGDFLDCYSVASDLSPREAAEIITAPRLGAGPVDDQADYHSPIRP